MRRTERVAYRVTLHSRSCDPTSMCGCHTLPIGHSQLRCVAATIARCPLESFRFRLKHIRSS